MPSTLSTALSPIRAPILADAFLASNSGVGMSSSPSLESKYLKTASPISVRTAMRTLERTYARFASASTLSGKALSMGDGGALPGGSKAGGPADNVSFWGAGITPDQLACMVLAYCHEEGIEVPVYFALDFQEHFGDMGTIASLDFGKLGLSRRMNRLMARDRILRKRYFYFKKRVSSAVLLRMAMRLGFEDLVSRRHGQALSYRDFLRQFLSQLDEGQAWNPASILNWEHEGQTGHSFHQMIFRTVGWSEEAIRVILGEDAERLLNRNAFVENADIVMGKGAKKRSSKKPRVKITAGKRRAAKVASRTAQPTRWVYDGDAKITMSQLVSMVMVYCDEEGIAVPAHFALDFRNHFGDMEPITSWYFERSDLCQRINALLSRDENLYERYDEFKRQVSSPIRLRLAMRLGFERFVAKRRGRWLSYRDLLKRFLGKLNEGQAWNSSSLLRWKYNKHSGHSLQSMIYRTVGWSEEAIEAILGEDADELLKRNPLIIGVINRKRAAKRLIMFLESLEAGESWNRTKLDWWKSSDGLVCGTTLIRWITENMGGGLKEEHVRALLGVEADRYLTRNPFRPHPANWRS